MSENSAFWLGSTLGDAASLTGWKGPYTDTYISDIQSRLLGNNDNQGFVVPGYNNNLRVYATGAMSVNVATGAAFVRGKVYENTAVNTLVVGANSSGSPRIDRIILRINYAAQTIRLFVLAGTPNATPILPILTQDAITYEISLAYIWVANGAASIADSDIHDEREFLTTFSSINDFFGNDNLIYNSEFMAMGILNGDLAVYNPEEWDQVATPVVVPTTRPSQMSRGRAIQITTNAANEGLSQTKLIKASTTYAIKLLTKVTSGDVGSIVVTTNSGAPSTITRYTRRVEEWVEEKIFYTTEADATTMTISILGLNNGDIVSYGQLLLVEGYFTGSFRKISELISFIDWISDVNWAFPPVAKSTGTTTIDLDTDFKSYILPGTKKILALIFIADAGAGNTSLNLRPYGTSTNQTRKEINGDNIDSIGLGEVSLDSNMRFDAYVQSSGALSASCTILILGIQT